MPTAIESRDRNADNMKGLLALLVIIGHCVYDWSEQGNGTVAVFLYLYSFHMPCFIYTSGMFVRYEKRGWVRWLYAYLVFQTVAGLMAGDVPDFLRPYYGLWYLLALAVWPFLASRIRPSRTAAGLLLAVSILMGFVPWAGRTLSASRIVCYFPFFLMGRGRLLDGLPKVLEYAAGAVCLLSLGLCAGAVAFDVPAPVQPLAFYNDLPYAAAGIDWHVRAAGFAIAACHVVAMRAFLPDREIPGLSYLGRHTLGVYCMHVLLMRRFGPVLFAGPLPYKLFMTGAFTAASCILFTSRRFRDAFRFLFDPEVLLDGLRTKKSNQKE